MKLYEIPRKSKFRIVGALVAPPAAPPLNQTDIYELETLDGMYSRCYDQEGTLVHIAAYTEVEMVS